jgi:hypothetical protein
MAVIDGTKVISEDLLIDGEFQASLQPSGGFLVMPLPSQTGARRSAHAKVVDPR